MFPGDLINEHQDALRKPFVAGGAIVCAVLEETHDSRMSRCARRSVQQEPPGFVRPAAFGGLISCLNTCAISHSVVAAYGLLDLAKRGQYAVRDYSVHRITVKIPYCIS